MQAFQTAFAEVMQTPAQSAAVVGDFSHIVSFTKDGIPV
jgi:hypothetical protein